MVRNIQRCVKLGFAAINGRESVCVGGFCFCGGLLGWGEGHQTRNRLAFTEEKILLYVANF